MEASPVHNWAHTYLSACPHRSIIPSRFCYDEIVWQKEAVRQGRIAGRVAVKGGRSFLRHVVPPIVKPIKTLWNEVIGFLFLSMGTIFGFSAIRSLRAGDGFRGCVASVCSVIMIWYGISSFWRARKISRS